MKTIGNKNKLDNILLISLKLVTFTGILFIAFTGNDIFTRALATISATVYVNYVITLLFRSY